MKLTDLVVEKMMEKEAAGLQLPANLAKKLINRSVRAGYNGRMTLEDMIKPFVDLTNKRVDKLMTKPGKSLHYYSRARELDPALQKRHTDLAKVLRKAKVKKDDFVYISDFASPQARTAEGWAELLRKNKKGIQGWENLRDIAPF